MAQNLTSLLGAEGKTRFLQLVASRYRKPCYRLRAYGPRGTVLLGDLSDYFKGFSPAFTDETKADSATLTLSNAGGQFDRYSSGSMSQWLLENNVLVVEKGLTDPATGTKYLVPAFWGVIAQARPVYNPKGEQVITVQCADAFKLPIKQKINSARYEKCEANTIAADLLRAIGKFPAPRIALAPVSRTYDFVQFPDVTLVDALKTLFDPLLFGVRADEAGNVTTRARLGSELSVTSGLLGFPDQLTAPPPEAVAFVVPDDLSLETIDSGWQDFDGVPNQIRVKGIQTAAQQSLGPSTALYQQGDSSVAADGRILQTFNFSDSATSGQNALVAHNVYIVFNYSTNHELDSSPQTKIISRMTWRAAWSSASSYRKGDAVSHGGSSWACRQDAHGTKEPGQTSGTGFWDALPVSGPFDTSFHIDNSDPHQVGYVNLETITASYAVLKIEGRQFSVGHTVTRRHGGFDFNFTIYGQPVLAFEKTLTAYADYKPETVTGETLVDLFDDHRTYQAAHQPLAMSVPVEVFKDGVSLGKIAADETDLSGESHFSVDFERGRVVLVDLTYQDFSVDTDASHPLSSGGTAQNTSSVFDLSLLDTPAPQALYQTRRETGDATYTLPGLPLGQGFDIRFHFADPTYGSEGERVFSVFAQGVKVIDGLDIAKQVGGPLRAYQQTVTGIAPDEDGTITIHVCQNDPVSGTRLEEAVGPSAIVSGIEVLYPQGQGAAPYAINCGGPALKPTPPVISANYAYSPVQQDYEIANEEINNPLVSTQDELQTMARFHVNRAAWRRHPHKIRLASVPHLQPGDLIQYYSPRINCDMWGYVYGIGRDMQAGGSDSDTLDLYLIYRQART